MSDPVVVHAEAVLASAREELVRADGKASLLLAAAGVAVGALMGGLIARDWTPFVLNNWVEWAWWLGVCATIIAVVALAWAVYPRTRPSDPRPDVISFYGDVVTTPAEALETRLEQTIALPREAALDQLRQVSLIVQRKYLAIQVALWAFAGGASLCAGAVVVHALTG